MKEINQIQDINLEFSNENGEECAGLNFNINIDKYDEKMKP